jgi:hypothetical protein
MARSAPDAIRLEAAAAAKQLHRRLRLKDRVTAGSGLVDVFDVIAELKIPLMFKPLDSALGLCLPKPLRGILVTTRRGVHIQRFTAAHELGHVVLEHRGSVDMDILERGPLSPVNGRPPQEVAADAFAAEFLLPRWLYRHHIRTQGWTVSGHLRNPDIVYQLSLRMGASYEATCWGLVGHQILPRGETDALRKVSVASLKARIGEKHRPGNSWADVWRVTGRDDGRTIVGNPDDLIRVELDEDSGSGFQWNAEALRQAGYEVLSDTSEFDRDPPVYGASAKRVLIARPAGRRRSALTLRETQPWRNVEPDDPKFSIAVELEGAEQGGFSRADQRRRGVQP